jgi:lipopolysaccharide export system permease protein
MLFQSSMRKELARSFGATLVVLITIILTIVLIQTLGRASRGTISPQDVMLIMAYAALGRLPTILTLSLFIAMLSTLSRMYQDSEMVVWFASGRGLSAFLRPLLRFAWPVLVLITVAALVIWPWTNQQSADMKQRYDQRGDLERIAPGQFQESANGQRVFFIDSDSEGRVGSNNIFITTFENTKNTVTTARAGRVEMANDVQMLVLQNGQRLEKTIGKPNLRISDFEEYGIITGQRKDVAAEAIEIRALSTLELLQSRSNSHQAELSWRLGLVFSAINFVVLALALAAVNPRAGRSSNIIFVLLIFILYSNLIGLGQTWVASGRIGLGSLLLLMHGSVLIGSLLWLAKRNENWSLADLLPRRSVPAQALAVKSSVKP